MVQKINIPTKYQDLIIEREDHNLYLYNGDIGLILYHYYKGVYSDDQKSYDKSFSIIEKQFENLAKYPYNYKFGYGIPGFAWVMQLLINEKFISGNEASSLDEIDGFIEKALNWNLEDGLYDLFVGYLGKGIYFFERLKFSEDNNQTEKSEKYRAVLETIVHNLDQFSVKAEVGVFWLDRYTSHYNEYRKDDPYAGIGLSHGVPSIIYFLGSCIQSGIATDVCGRLIEEAISWMLSMEEKHNEFPRQVYEDGDFRGGVDLSWCYGLFSVACSFWIAGKVLKNEEWVEKSISIVEYAASLEVSTYPIHEIDNNKNIFFCHGTAGFAYLFDKFYQLTKIPLFKLKSEIWSEVTFDELDKYKKESLKEEAASLLDGLAGVDLTLMTLGNPDRINTNWDKLFLLDIQKF